MLIIFVFVFWFGIGFVFMISYDAGETKRYVLHVHRPVIHVCDVNEKH